MYVIEPQEIENKFKAGFEAPNSYEKLLTSKYTNESYNKDTVVWEEFRNDYEGGSDSTYTVWYKSTIGSNQGNAPHESPLYWEVITPDNASAYLDKYIDTKTFSKLDTPLKIIVDGGLFDTISMFNITAKYVFIEYLDEQGATQVISKSLLEDTEYFTFTSSIGDERYAKSTLVNFPIVENQSCVVTFSNVDINTSSGYVAVGKITKGRARYIGDAYTENEISLMSLTEKSKDSSGFSFYDKKNTYKEAKYQIIIPNENRGLVFRLMESLDAIDCVFTPFLNDTDMSLVIYGSYNDFALVMQNSNDSEYALYVEGVI